MKRAWLDDMLVARREAGKALMEYSETTPLWEILSRLNTLLLTLDVPKHTEEVYHDTVNRSAAAIYERHYLRGKADGNTNDTFDIEDADLDESLSIAVNESELTMQPSLCAYALAWSDALYYSTGLEFDRPKRTDEPIDTVRAMARLTMAEDIRNCLIQIHGGYGTGVSRAFKVPDMQMASRRQAPQVASDQVPPATTEAGSAPPSEPPCPAPAEALAGEQSVRPGHPRTRQRAAGDPGDA